MEKDTKKTEVVTCFLRDARTGEVLLLRRPEEAPTYGGCWGAVSGYVETEETDEDAYREVREETGLEPELIFRGNPFVVKDDTFREGFFVHPYLFGSPTRDITPNYESDLAEWSSPTDILRRNTVPRLWKSYSSVAPTVETVAKDDEDGSAHISGRALEVLRDTAAVGGHAQARNVARCLAESRPSMAVVGNRVARAYEEGTADGAGAEGVERSAHRAIEKATVSDTDAATEVSGKLGEAVVTVSRSGTVAKALKRADTTEAVVSESLPGGEGIGFAEEIEELTDASFSVVAVPDSCVTGAVRGADAVLVGADTVLPDGSVVNKVGTTSLALAAEYHGIPFYAVASVDKIAPEGFEFSPETTAWRGKEVPVFEAVPSELVTVVTEKGVLSEERIGKTARRNERLRRKLG